LRSIGKANEIVELIGCDQNLFDEVFIGIFDKEPLIRMRSADIIEKVSKKFPKLLGKHKTQILENLNLFKQQEVRWHIALIISYLELNKFEAEKVFSVLSYWTNNDESKIVKVNSLQALTDISLQNSNIKSKTKNLIKDQMKTNTPSIIARSKKLLKKLEDG